MAKTDWNNFKEEMKTIISNKRMRLRAAEEEEEVSAPVSTVNSRPPLYLIALFVLAITLGVVIYAQNKEREVAVDAGTPILQTAPSEVEVLRAQMKTMDDKLCLLGSAHNNNWYSLYQRKPSEDIVYFGSDWRLNRRPPNLQVQDEAERLFSEWAN